MGQNSRLVLAVPHAIYLLRVQLSYFAVPTPRPTIDYGGTK